MEIKLNGKCVESSSHTLMDLVLEKGFDPEAVVAEVNFRVICQNSWKDLDLNPGDSIEILNFVGGG